MMILNWYGGLEWTIIKRSKVNIKKPAKKLYFAKSAKKESLFP